jgi:hypothetical protein
MMSNYLGRYRRLFSSSCSYYSASSDCAFGLFSYFDPQKKSRLGAPHENLAVEWAIHSRVSDVRVNHGREVLSPPSRRGSKAREMRNAIYRPMRLIFSQVQAKKANKDSEIWLSSRKTNRNKYSHGRELFVPRKKRRKTSFRRSPDALLTRS